MPPNILLHLTCLSSCLEVMWPSIRSRDRKSTYLIALLSFSYVMPGLFFFRPHIFATASDWTNLKTPDSLSSHLNNDGLRFGSFNKSLTNSHKWFPFEPCPTRRPFLGFVSVGDIGSSMYTPSSLETLEWGRTREYNIDISGYPDVESDKNLVGTSLLESL